MHFAALVVLGDADFSVQNWNVYRCVRLTLHLLSVTFP